MGFLDNYEASRERLERWNRTYPLGRIETRIVEFSAEKGYVLVEAKAYRNDTELPSIPQTWHVCPSRCSMR